MRRYYKSERSTFSYWFAHWCAFQLTALKCHVWEPRFLFHDIMKPWMKLFWPYEKVQRFHRTHSRHHLEWLERGTADTLDLIGMVIDWECSLLTKESADHGARVEINYLYLTSKISEDLRDELLEVCSVLGL